MVKSFNVGNPLTLFGKETKQKSFGKVELVIDLYEKVVQDSLENLTIWTKCIKLYTYNIYFFITYLT